MNTLINNILNDINKTTKTHPVKESGDVYAAEFELAGFCKKDVDIKVTDNILTVDAKTEGRKIFMLLLVSKLSTLFAASILIFLMMS
eukprot:COSAG02_NODE_10373_length_1956_cov_1.835757_2_plen_87_part_00